MATDARYLRAASSCSSHPECATRPQRRPRDARDVSADWSRPSSCRSWATCFRSGVPAPDSLGREPREVVGKFGGRAEDAPDPALGRHRPVEHTAPHPARRHRVTRAGPRHGRSRRRRHRNRGPGGIAGASCGRPTAIRCPARGPLTESTWPFRLPPMSLGAAPFVDGHEQRSPIGAAEHAGEAAAVELDRLQHLAALAHAHAALVADVAVPDGSLGVEADAVGVVVDLGPRPSVRTGCRRPRCRRP